MPRGTEWGDPGQPVEGGNIPGGGQDRPDQRREPERQRDRPQGRKRVHDPADDDTQPIPTPGGVHRE